MAAKPPTRSAPEPVWSEPLLAVSTVTWHFPVCCCLLFSKSGNERLAFAALCCNCAKPIAIRAPIFGDRKVSAAHLPVCLPDGGGRARRSEERRVGKEW